MSALPMVRGYYHIDGTGHPPEAGVLVNRGLKSGRVDTYVLTPAEMVNLARELLVNAERIERHALTVQIRENR
jgi:hypothetical protein